MNIRFGSEIAAAAAAHHLDPRLLAAVAAQETGGPGSNSGNNVVGDGGHGRGLFQIDDRFWSFARTAAAMDPAKNAQVAAGILSDNLKRYGGNVRAALSAYNAGSPTATGTRTPWADGKVLGYADSVLRHYENLGGVPEHVAADARGGLKAADPLGGAAYATARATPLQGSIANVPMGLLPPQNFASLLAPPPLPQASAAAALPSWTKLTQASSSEAAAGDRAMADLIDAGDVFGTDASSDEA